MPPPPNVLAKAPGNEGGGGGGGGGDIATLGIPANDIPCPAEDALKDDPPSPPPQGSLPKVDPPHEGDRSKLVDELPPSLPHPEVLPPPNEGPVMPLVGLDTLPTGPPIVPPKSPNPVPKDVVPPVMPDVALDPPEDPPEKLSAKSPHPPALKLNGIDRTP